ncbi:MAG: DUF58 domain-containing protein [Gemmatimonadaceae bacterium]
MTEAGARRTRVGGSFGRGLRAARAATAFLPTRRLAAAIALLAPLWLLAYTRAGALPALAAFAIVALAALRDALWLPSARDIEVETTLPETVGIGDRVASEYRVRSRWPARLRFRLHDALPDALERTPEAAAAPLVPLVGWASDGPAIPLAAHEEVALPVTVEGRRRGTYGVGTVVLRVIGPLGLAQRSLSYTLRADDGSERAREVTVTPSLSGVRRYRLLTVQHRLRDAGVRALRKRGGGTSFANLREYSVGDDPRRIDWKASARRQKLVTREYAVEQGQTVVIAVDAGRLMTQLADPLPRFEYALSSALVLADVAIGSGDLVGLLVFDDEVRAWVPPARGLPALQRLRDALIPAQTRMVEPDYALAFRTLASRHRRRSLIVLYTDVIDARASQSLIAHTARSAARHLPIVVALRNDRLVAAAVPDPFSGTAALYESAAAEELLSARDDALLRMRRAGVSVLDVSPQRLSAAVINRYLEVKARAAL